MMYILEGGDLHSDFMTSLSSFLATLPDGVSYDSKFLYEQCMQCIAINLCVDPHRYLTMLDIMIDDTSWLAMRIEQQDRHRFKSIFSELAFNVYLRVRQQIIPLLDKHIDEPSVTFMLNEVTPTYLVITAL
jgi:hypothetical protein